MVDFTGERTTDDRVGHSTFMTGTIGSHAECAGFAPGAELTIVRVFDSTQRSTTAWFLEGFNFALHRRFDLVNLAVGGPDFRDAPFAAKVRELARAGITIVSGVGNSGPGWGSLLNPADDALVIGRAVLRSPVALKQVLHASSERLRGASYLEQATATTTAAELTDDEISDDEIADDEISDDEIADVLDVSFAWSPSLDAGVGFVGVALAVRLTRREWEGVVTGEILIEVSSEAEFYGAAPTTAPTTAPTAAPTTRSVRVPTSYPNGFFPTDELEAHAIDLMDVRGDHPHTNLRALTTALRAAGFYVETLSGDVSSFDAAEYGALLLLDPEEPWMPHEVAKLTRDVHERGLGIVVAADWYDVALMNQLYYRDELAHTDHPCGMGGSNVPMLNELLSQFGFELHARAYSGRVALNGRGFAFRSGTALARAPAGTLIISAEHLRVAASDCV
ncbi:membrane-bound transcription factor site-1 protease [Chrysochromulina tobinii]|uniref:Membrane-bound transcription factor site-1 protease n=1 Tax=Chrysochromulina tobinii TaxID=1460289 RepID=A0A0M0K9U8_9EUKA|nr:membrane-bound transcription factor site-1 protease [Chrysochromulina tobinii]|eukprot:KOO35188.1 membrane-bound transcription factor site-1 protease [Chrysochromulina sp. CCMP291]